MTGFRLGPATASRRSAGWRPTSSTSSSIGGGVVGAGAALDAATRGLRVGLVEARDWASGTSQPLVAAGARRPALPRAARLRAGARGAATSAACCCSGWRRTWCARCRSSTRCTHRGWERPYVGAGRRALRRALGVSRARARALPRHRHLSRKPGAAAGARPATRTRSSARSQLLRRPGRRRPAHARLVRTAAALRRARSPTGARVDGLPARGRAGRRRHGARPGDRRASSRSGPSRWSTRPGSGPTTRRRWSASAGQFHVRAIKGIHLVVPRDRIQLDTGMILRTEKSRAVRASRGAGTGSSAPPTPTGTLDKAHPAASARRHRLPARPRQPVSLTGR